MTTTNTIGGQDASQIKTANGKTGKNGIIMMTFGKRKARSHLTVTLSGKKAEKESGITYCLALSKC